MAPPRHPRSRWFKAVVVLAVLYAAAYALSARVAVILSPSDRFGVGLIAGAILLEDRWGSPKPFGTGPRQHSLVYVYTHRFRFNWWYRTSWEAARPAAVPPGLGGIPLLGIPAAGYRSIKVPLWMPLIPVAAILGFAAFIRSRIPPGHCRGCGYDLRGLPAAVCPECGRGLPPSERAPIEPATAPRTPTEASVKLDIEAPQQRG